MKGPNPKCRFRYQMLSNADPAFDGFITRATEWERSQMNISGLCSSGEIDALDISVNAELSYMQRQYTRAMDLVKEALRKCPRSVDALRILCKLLNPSMTVPGRDPDTYMCMLRECMSFFRPYYYRNFEELGGRGTEAFQLRPVVRFLNTLASPKIMADRVDVCTHALEEVLRLDHEDHTFAREKLLLCYLKVLGRAHRRQVCYVQRDERHIRALIDCHFPESEFPLFDKVESTPGWYNEDLMVVRWAEIMLDYKNNGDRWKDLVKKENELCPWMLECQLAEIPLRFLKPPKGPTDYLQRNANRIAERLAICLIDWPKLLIDMYKLIYGRTSLLLEERLRKTVPVTFPELCREGKMTKVTVAVQFLEQGRVALRTGRYPEALQCFTLARCCYAEMMRPGFRWYLNAPFQIVSNRALAAERMQLWPLCRVDTRFTLVMQPDHLKSYERLPLIASMFDAPDLAKELTTFVSDLKENKPATTGEWRKKANYAVAMISIKALMLSKMDMLTDAAREELIKDGIDDMYEPIAVDLDLLDNLPWLEESDLDL